MIRRAFFLLSVVALFDLPACKSDDAPTQDGNGSSSGQPSSSSGSVPDAGPTKSGACTGGPCECNAGEDCQQSCSVAGCAMLCKAQSVCSATCETTATGCSQTCESGADCNFVCLGGGCAMRCKAGSKCKMTCGGAGACAIDCETGADCKADCAAANCTCNGVKC